MQFEEIQVPSERRGEASDTRTLFQVAIRPKRDATAAAATRMNERANCW